MPHILLLEDDETIAFGIRCAMEKEGSTTVWCRTLKEAEACLDGRVELVLLDLNLPDGSGFAFCSLQNEEGTFNFMPWVWSTGATSYEMNSEGGIKALTFIKDLVDSGAMSKECINWTQGDVMNQFISGNVAMMINGPWQIPTIRQEAPDLNWDVALIPKDKEFASDLGGENWAVIAGGNEAGALDFLNYATQPEQVSFMMNTMGYISADKEIAKTQFTADGDAVYRKFIEEMEYTKARGPLAEWPSVSDAISLAFNQVMTGAMEPDKAAADAQAAIDTIVK